MAQRTGRKLLDRMIETEYYKLTGEYQDGQTIVVDIMDISKLFARARKEVAEGLRYGMSFRLQLGSIVRRRSDNTGKGHHGSDIQSRNDRHLHWVRGQDDGPSYLG